MQIPYLLPRRGQNKPAGIPRINWQHPIARGLVSYCYDTGGGVAIDLVTGGVGTQVKTATNTAIGIATSAFGQGWQYAAQGGVAGAETNHIEFVNSSIATNNLANAPYSGACGFIPTANSTAGVDAAIWGIGDNAQNVQFAVGLFNSNPGLNVEVAFADGTFILGTLAVALNQYATVAMNQPTSTTGNIYTVQGGSFTKDAQTGLSPYLSLTGLTPSLGDTVQGNATTGHFCNYNGFIFYGAAWKRIIADDEVRSLHDDPWQFLIFPEDEIFATLVGAASGPVFIGPDKYMQRLSEPQRALPNLRASQPFGSLVPAAPFGENITPDKWFQRLSEPQRQKPGLLAALQQAFPAFVQAAPFNENINPDKWYRALSEPQRQRLGLGTQDQQAFAWSSFTPGAEFIGPDKYMQALSEPQRSRPGLNPAAQQFFAIDTSAIPISKLFWFNPLSEPVRTRTFATALQQPFTTDTATIPITQLMPWFGALSEPVRLPPGLRAWLQQAYPAFDPLPFTPSLGWYEALSEPVRSLPALRAALQAFQALVLQPPPLNIFDNWYQPLSEPVRIKPGLLAALQQFFAGDPLVIDTSRIETWYQQLSEPQRQRIWLLAALQQAWTGPPRVITNPNFFAVMRAIEQFDTFLGGGVMFNKPVSAETGVFEQFFAGSESGVIGDTTSATSGVVSASTSVRVIT